MTRFNGLHLDRLRILPPPLTLTDAQRAKLLTVFQSAETASAWLAQVLGERLAETPEALDHPQYALWHTAAGVAQGLLDLREMLVEKGRG